MNHWNQKGIYTTWNYRKIHKGYTRYSAGVLPYTFDQTGKCLFLLGKDNDNDWSDFGGRCEFKDHNEPLNTASREFYEETLGAVLSIQECLDKINTKPFKIISKTLNGSPYYMYLVYVDYTNYSESFNKTLQFLKYQYSTDKNIYKIIEKTSIRWVSMDTILNCIENKNAMNPIPLRGVFYKTMESCKDQLMFLNEN
jgi:hypothetical protein